MTLTLPWSHRLPDHAAHYPLYGQNLVEVASAIAAASNGQRFAMLDIGANVGDSALQVLRRVDADVVCIDGDAYWLTFLRENTAHDARVKIVHAMLLPQHEFAGFSARRSHGTTHFVPSERTADVPHKTAEMLKAELRMPTSVRLIKLDVDGFDARLLPGLASAFQDARPVLFFEFDPALARTTGDPHPERVWPKLFDLNYERGLVWDNFGHLLGAWPLAEVQRRAPILNGAVTDRGYHYWDVALLHRDDPHKDAIERALKG